KPDSQLVHFTNSNFKILPSDQPIEEEAHDNLTKRRYYPVRIGDLIRGKYQVLDKLGYGLESTVWLANELRQRPVVLKVFTNDLQNRAEIDVHNHLMKVQSKHPGRDHIRIALDAFSMQGPNGEHHCLVYEPMLESAQDLLRRNPSDISGFNILLGINDKSIIQSFVKAEQEHPSARKDVQGYTVYASRAFDSPSGKSIGEPLLSDFGSAVSGDIEHDEDVQPNVYRAPEVCLKAPWSYSIDIWNVGCMIWDLFEGKHLFYGRDPKEGKYMTRAHLADMVALLGPPPVELLKVGKRSTEFFDKDGGWTADIPVPARTSLEESEKNLEGYNKEAFLRFMRKMLQWRPELRQTASQLLEDDWLNGQSRNLRSWPLQEDFVKWHLHTQCRQRSTLREVVKGGGLTTPGGSVVKPYDTVELKDGTFLRIICVMNVIRNGSQKDVAMYGWRFVSNQRTSGLPKESPNEVYWVIHLTPKDSRPATDQAPVRVSSSQVVRKRRLSLISEKCISIRRSVTFDNDELFCKRKYVVMTDTGKEERPLDAFSLPAAEIAEASFERLQEEDCDGESQNVTAVGNRAVSSKNLRHVGVEKQHSGALSSALAALSLHDNTHDGGTLAPYTFADICCGAEGASRGAAMAGLELLYSLDHDPAACDNYRLNFPQVRLYQDSLDSFVSKKRPNLEADIMHFSFPCQAYSQANTRPNLEKDALNIAANTKLGGCLDITKPRVVCIEQTSGLMSLGSRGGKHHTCFSNFIEQFTSRNYSVVWRNVNFADYGLPQQRNRLIMVATREGEPLLKFPEPTHTRDPDSTKLPRFTSVAEAIKGIPQGYPNHDWSSEFASPRRQHNGDAPLGRTILTGGTTEVHPSGLRAFSNRELACLQGFPLYHKFSVTASRTEVKKQIGNAFPPSVAAVLFGSIKRQLQERDGMKPK
ncbi:MAG: hypothetical protein Q9205_004552, partial [Flavoplaca limonia]